MGLHAVLVQILVFLALQPTLSHAITQTPTYSLARMLSYVTVYGSKSRRSWHLFQVTSYNVVSSEYAAFTGDAKDESGAKTKKKKKAASESDSESGDSDSSSNFGKTLKQARTAKKAPAKKKGKKLDALFGVQWWRIVLGEPTRRLLSVRSELMMVCDDQMRRITSRTVRPSKR
jgi:hypothetical protein